MGRKRNRKNGKVTLDVIIPGVIPSENYVGNIDFVKILDEFHPENLSQSQIERVSEKFLTTSFFSGAEESVPSFYNKKRQELEEASALYREYKIEKWGYEYARSCLIAAICAKILAYIYNLKDSARKKAAAARKEAVKELNYAFEQLTDQNVDDEVICSCALLDEEYNEPLAIAVCETIDDIGVTNRRSSVYYVSTESAMGKACLRAIANESHEFKVNDILYQLEKFKIFNEEKLFKHIGGNLNSQRVIVGNKEQKKIEFKDFVIRRNARGCVHRDHTVTAITARMPIINNSGLSYVDVPATYCKECNLYFIREDAFQMAKDKGTLACKVMDEIEYRQLQGKSLYELAPKSILRIMGYTVEQKSDPGTIVRRQILALAVDYNILSGYQVINYLNFFIRMHEGQDRYDIAVGKWESDRKFLQDYTKGDYITYGVKSIKRKNYIYT